jgi:hypothetical protein
VRGVWRRRRQGRSRAGASLVGSTNQNPFPPPPPSPPPMPASPTTCPSTHPQVCGRRWVPEGMLATIEPPSRLLTRGDACLIEARVCRPRTKGAGEGDASQVSQVSFKSRRAGGLGVVLLLFGSCVCVWGGGGPAGRRLVQRLYFPVFFFTVTLFFKKSHICPHSDRANTSFSYSKHVRTHLSRPHADNHPTHPTRTQNITGAPLPRVRPAPAADAQAPGPGPQRRLLAQVPAPGTYTWSWALDGSLIIREVGCDRRVFDDHTPQMEGRGLGGGTSVLNPIHWLVLTPPPPHQTPHTSLPPQIGSSLIIGTLTGTALFVSALPPLAPLSIRRTCAVKVS